MIEPDDTTSIDEILDFWFLDAESGRRDRPRLKRWFASGRKLDGPVRERFGESIVPVAAGRHAEWSRSPEGRLALILLLDQFPRHVWRGDAMAFAFSEAARRHCIDGLEGDQDRHLPVTMRVFFYLPLEHAESLADQDRSVALFRALVAEVDDADEALAGFVERALESAEEHREIVARFGRYPHRNAALGRDSTDEERGWLEAGGKGFGQ